MVGQYIPILRSKYSGFTLVELLVVIVVIAILASITIISYSGMQNRAYDAAVRSDLHSIAAKLQIYKNQYGHYPNPYPPASDPLMSDPIQVSKDSYPASATGKVVNNMPYCTTDTDTQYAMAALSKSGHAFVISSTNTAVQEAPSGLVPWAGIAALCSTLLPSATTITKNWWYNGGNSTYWQAWIAQ